MKIAKKKLAKFGVVALVVSYLWYAVLRLSGNETAGLPLLVNYAVFAVALAVAFALQQEMQYVPRPKKLMRCAALAGASLVVMVALNPFAVIALGKMFG